jgi:hypothetical protein
MKQKTKRRKRKHTTATKARKESHLTEFVKAASNKPWAGTATRKTRWRSDCKDENVVMLDEGNNKI